jgi:drug/metabolite transporter (DMT)-like permease
MLGYLFVILAAVFWGISGILAKRIFVAGLATPLTISETRVFVGWLAFLLYAIARGGLAALRVPLSDLWRFALLGVIGVAGANFGLYFAISKMDAALADVIQFTAPTMVAAWMWLRGEEQFDAKKLLALVATTLGVALALGLATKTVRMSPLGTISALISALSYTFLMVWGKHLSMKYDRVVILHYAMLGAFLFWLCIQPPAKLALQLSFSSFFLLGAFGVVSVVIPYTCFFLGLSRVPASGAGIVSTLEPVVIAIGAHFTLGEHLTFSQIVGVALVLCGVGLVEFSRNARNAPSKNRAAYG